MKNITNIRQIIIDFHMWSIEKEFFINTEITPYRMMINIIIVNKRQTIETIHPIFEIDNNRFSLDFTID
jgi:hypothetical protein